MPITFQHRQLPNGLTIIAETNPQAQSSAVGFFVKTGSRDETPDVMGVSHYLEHMVFKGTAKRSADDVNRQFDQIGASYNAWTSQENTVFYAHVLPEYLSDAVDLLGDILRPALRDADFEMEKNVILEEIGMYEDRPSWRLQDTIIEKYFGKHPMSYRVLGTEASVKALTAEQMRGYFEAKYCPSRMVVSASGQLDFEKLVVDIEKSCGHWKKTSPSRTYQPVEVVCGREAIIDAEVNRHYIAMMTPAPSAQDPLRYAAKVLTDVIGDTDGSRLYWDLVDKGIAEEADLAYFPHDRVGSFFAYASCDPDRAQQVETQMIKTIESYVSSIDEAEIQRVKNKLATEVVLAGESVSGRMQGLGGQWVYSGKYIPLEQELEALMNVSSDDLRALISHYDFSQRRLVTLGPA